MNVLLTLPLSTADCERGFSVLKRIKTEVRNSLGPVNLNWAMLVAIEGAPIEEFDFDKCTLLFRSSKKRRVV